MSHVHHESLPGYNPSQLLHDGCPECEYRGANPGLAIQNLDFGRWVRAWARAEKWQKGKLTATDQPASAEIPMLQAIWGFALILERYHSLPVGYYPANEELRTAGIETYVAVAMVRELVENSPRR